ncbi:MAG: PfkB family carbohydrate kinase [Clostridiales bacterium]
MITILCGESVINNFIYVDKFVKGQKCNTSNKFRVFGGKGLNLAKFLSGLNEKVCLIGFKAGENGDFIDKEITNNNVLSLLIEVEGNTKENTIIIDNDNKTEFISMGPKLKKEDIILFEDVFEEVIEKTDLLICSGDIMDGLENTFYNKYIGRANERNIYTIIDSSNFYLETVIKIFPKFVFIDEKALSDLNSTMISTYDDIVENSRMLISRGVESVLVTTKKFELLYISKKDIYKIDDNYKSKKSLDLYNELLLAGYINGIINKKSISESLKIAITYAKSNFEYVI